MNAEEQLVRRLIDAHNRGGDSMLDDYDELLAPDFAFTPMTVGVMGSLEPATYHGRDGLRRYYITLVYWVRDGKAVRLQAFRSRDEALEAARA